MEKVALLWTLKYFKRKNHYIFVLIFYIFVLQIIILSFGLFNDGRRFQVFEIIKQLCESLNQKCVTNKIQLNVYRMQRNFQFQMKISYLKEISKEMSSNAKQFM